MKVYIIKTQDGKYIGIDDASGGYPYETEYWHQAQLWMNKEQLDRYVETFKKYN